MCRAAAVAAACVRGVVMATAALAMCSLGRMCVRMVVVVPVVMPMVVAVAIVGHMAAVGTAFGFKRQVGFDDGHVHAAQHVGQHMVGLNFQVVGLQFDGHMAVAQVVRSKSATSVC